MTDGYPQPNEKNLFSRKPHYEEMDYCGGLIGKKTDYNLHKEIPLEMQCDFHEILIALGAAMGYNKPVEDAASHIKRHTYDYCKTYLN
jgi:hypothetical protein